MYKYLVGLHAFFFYYTRNDSIVDNVGMGRSGSNNARSIFLFLQHSAKRN